MSKKQVLSHKMSIRVQFEIGHTAVLKAKKGADNFTHDWELYVKGVDKADISSYIEKIVFNLHESFPKPKRTFKEPPYVLKESGYAGFILPIDIHFKNRTMQTYQYDIDLQPSGPPMHKCEIKKHIFENPSDEFRQKLLKGAGSIIGNSENDKSHSSEIDYQHKIKNSSNSSGNVNIGHDLSSKKSHKIRPDKSKVQNFENIFGKPITKTTTPVSNANMGGNNNLSKNANSLQDQKNKSINMNISQTVSNSSKLSNQMKSDKLSSNPNTNVKERIENPEKSEKKEKHKHSSHKDKNIKDGKDRKEDKHDKREDRKKDKSHSKERDRSTEKSSKNRLESPQRKKQRTTSPITSLTSISRKSPSRSSSSASKEDKSKSSTQNAQSIPQTQPQSQQQSSNIQTTNDVDKKISNSSSSKKSKKEKKSHDKDKERESRKDRDSKAQKDFDQASRSSSTVSYQGNSGVSTSANMTNNVESNKVHKADPTKSLSKSKAESKLQNEAAPSLTSSNILNSLSAPKNTSEKHDNDEKRHKHKKKDKSKDKEKEKIRDKEGSSSKDKDKKKEKKFNKDEGKKSKEEDVGSNATSSSNLGPTESLHESLFNSDHESRHSDIDKVVHHSENSNHPFSGNIIKNKTTQNNAGNTPKQISLNSSTIPQVPSNDNIAAVVEKKDKKIKDQKIEKEEKKRKRKSREGTVDSTASSAVNNANVSESHSKMSKKNSNESKNTEKHTSSSQHVQPQHQQTVQPQDSFRAPSASSGSSISCSSVPTPQQHSVSRTNISAGGSANSGFDLDYISELKELQEKIMTLQDNNELQKVVEIIAATGRFEITSKTFDFDLCALDRNTIQRLHVIV